MEDELKRIVVTVLGTTVFMFLALFAIAIFSSGRILDVTTESAQKSAGVEPKTSGEETLATIIEQPHG